MIGARNAAHCEVVLAAADCRQVQVATCDVTDPVSIDGFVGAAAARLDGIDILISCANTAERKSSEGDWALAVQAELTGTVRALDSALPFLRQSDRAAVVTLSSVSARTQSLAYSATKAVIEQFTVAAARRHARDGVRINCVAAGATDASAELWDPASERLPERHGHAPAALWLAGLASAEDIAAPIVYLASTNARWITGQCLVVDGGHWAGGVL